MMKQHKIKEMALNVSKLYARKYIFSTEESNNKRRRLSRKEVAKAHWSTASQTFTLKFTWRYSWLRHPRAKEEIGRAVKRCGSVTFNRLTYGFCQKQSVRENISCKQLLKKEVRIVLCRKGEKGKETNVVEIRMF